MGDRPILRLTRLRTTGILPVARRTMGARVKLRLAIFAIAITLAEVAWAGVEPGAAASPLPGEALQAISGGVALVDLTLTGTANFVAGSDQESGSFTLLVKGNQESKLTLNLSGGTRQEIRSPVVAPVSPPASSGAGSGSAPAGSSSPGIWISADGTKHAMAQHNCWVDASVLFPSLSLQWASSDPQMSVVEAGPTLFEGATLDHLQLSRTIPGQTPAMTAEIKRLSAVDIYLDPLTHLPVALEFNTHPDNTLTINIPVEIRFSDYRTVNGVQVPFHIQKFLQRTLTLDLTVTSATVNSGLADSEFAL